MTPVTCVALARVRIKARFSSSDSADRTVFGSLRKRVNCGCTSELPNAVINRRAVLSTLERRERRAEKACSGRRDIRARRSTLPQVQLVLVGLGHGSQTVQVTEQLDSVMWLDVVHPVAKHLQEGVQDPPRVTLKHVWQQLACLDKKRLVRRHSTITFLYYTKTLNLNLVRTH